MYPNMFGFEKEYFVYESGADTPTLPSLGLSVDEDNLLVEARSQPQSTILGAAFSLLESEYREKKRAEKADLEILDVAKDTGLSFTKYPRKAKIEASRRGGKPPIAFRNLYGHEHHKVPSTVTTAGIHLSVSNQQTIWDGKGKPKHVVNGMFDFARFFGLLDKEFAEEIKSHKRNPGFYEIKPDGRIEYRSLPAGMDILEVAERASSVLSKLWSRT